MSPRNYPMEINDLLNQPFRFWRCPEQAHLGVTWCDDGIARCDVCDNTSHDNLPNPPQRKPKMDNKKRHSYYLVEQVEKEQADALFEKDIEPTKTAILDELTTVTGCVAWRKSSNWGHPSYIAQLVFPADHAYATNPDFKVHLKTTFEDKPVVCITGKGNTKAGCALNKVVGQYNQRLREYPDYIDWLICKHFKIMSVGLGGPGAKGGQTMLSTHGGVTNDGNAFVFAIPNSKSEDHVPVDIPDSFKQITYGAFHDLTDNDDE